MRTALKSALILAALCLLAYALIPREKGIEKKIEEYLAKSEYLTPTPLCKLMTSLGSDKGSGIRHNYTSLYSKLFSHLKNKEISLFEMGLGTNYLDLPSNMGAFGKPGASLYGWAAHFPKAHVYGADIDRRILFHTQNIKTFYCDQRDKQCIQKMFANKNLKNVSFDVMIDDGLHEFEANLTLLTNSMHKLKKGGLYIIEDLHPQAQLEFQRRLSELQKQFSLKAIQIVSIPIDGNKEDNTLLIIQK